VAFCRGKEKGGEAGAGLSGSFELALDTNQYLIIFFGWVGSRMNREKEEERGAFEGGEEKGTLAARWICCSGCRREKEKKRKR